MLRASLTTRRCRSPTLSASRSPRPLATGCEGLVTECVSLPTSRQFVTSQHPVDIGVTRLRCDPGLTAGGAALDRTVRLPTFGRRPLTQHDATVQLASGMTWYRIDGELQGSRLPLLILHGGPGSTHDYLDGFTDLSGERAVIHYDQLGNGRSEPVDGRSPASWTVDLFLRQLDELIEHLGIAKCYGLLGHSWGGMLGAEHAVRRPTGLQALVLANTPASMRLWIEAAETLRHGLPPEVQATLLRHERQGTVDDPEYRRALDIYDRRHMCRLDPWPMELQSTVAAKKAHPAVFQTTIGLHDCRVTGTLRDWSIVDRCDRISVPTLLISGRNDEATLQTVQPFALRIPNVRWAMFQRSSHMPHLEEREACMATVRAFLASCDDKIVSRQKQTRPHEDPSRRALGAYKEGPIVRGGSNIVPAPMEEVLRASSAVRDAVVVGVPDPEAEERVAALVQLESGTVGLEG